MHSTYIVNENIRISEKSPHIWSKSPANGSWKDPQMCSYQAWTCRWAGRQSAFRKTRISHRQIFADHFHIFSQHMRHPLRAKGECNKRLPLHRWIWWISMDMMDMGPAQNCSDLADMDVCSACFCWSILEHQKMRTVSGPHLDGISGMINGLLHRQERLSIGTIRTINKPSKNMYPLVNKHSYWKWQFLIGFPIQNGDFP